jgi:alpha-galactosidase
MGCIVETNAIFRANTLLPVQAGKVPEKIFYNVNRIARENDRAVEAALSRDLNKALAAFKQDHMVASLKESDQEELFRTMYEGTKEYLKEYH